MKFKLTILFLLAVCAAFAQSTPFYNPTNDIYWSFDNGSGGPEKYCNGCSYPQSSSIYQTPAVGVEATCLGGTIAYIQVEQVNQCYYENRANVQATYTEQTGNYTLTVSGYNVVLNPSYNPWWTNSNWAYSTDCDRYPGVRIVFDYEYGCP